MVIRVRLVGHAAPSANARDEARDRQGFVSAAIAADERAPRDGCVDSGLWWGRRRLSSAPAASTFLHHGECDASGGIRSARESVGLHGDGIRHEQHGSDLERERICRRFDPGWNDFHKWGLYSPGRPALWRLSASDGNERGRSDEIRVSNSHGNERCFRFAYAGFGHCRTRREASFSSKHSEPGAPRSNDSLELKRNVLPQRLRNRGRKRKLYGATDLARIRDRKCDRHKRRRSFQAKCSEHHDYQSLHVAVVRTCEYRRGREQHAGGASHPGSRFEPQHVLVVVRER
jgi:hypothetical protein